MKILHLIDDEKFTDFVISQNLNVKSIDEHRLDHTFLAFGKDYIFTKKHRQELKLIANFNDYKLAIQENKYDILVIHCLTQYKAFALQNSSMNFKIIVWCMWGVDFYSLPWLQFNAYYPETAKHLDRISFREKFKSKFRPLYYKLKYGSTLKNAQKNVIEDVDFFSPIVPSEYDIANKISFFKAKKINYSYCNLNTVIGNLQVNENKLKYNIFIGNSATPESNHLDILIQLNALDLKYRKIIVPLSYGQPHTYGKEVKNFGKKLFNENFIGITDFIPLEEYVNNIKSCGFCIMNHKRQQGLGNALLFLLLGSKLFLSEENPMYEYFKSINVKVYSIENDLNHNEVSKLLDASTIYKNRKIIETLYSEKSIQNVYSKFYESITENK